MVTNLLSHTCPRSMREIFSSEQSSAISEVSLAIRQMDEITQHNAALVEETNAAIEQTEAQANELDQIVERFVVGEVSPHGQELLTSANDTIPIRGPIALRRKYQAAADSYFAKRSLGGPAPGRG